MGVWATHIDDIFCCGEKNILDLARRRLQRRLEASKSQKTDFAHFGMELPKGKDFSETLTQRKFTGSLQSIPATKESRVSGHRKQKMEEIRRRLCK